MSSLNATRAAHHPDDPEQPIHIGILGGGPAGLMSALALEAYLPSHVRLTLLDRNASETDYPGVEYGIQARACRALERIGQLDTAMRRSNPCTEVAFFNARLGKRFRSIRPDPRYTRAVVRQEFLADLANLLRRTALRRRHEVHSILMRSDQSVVVQGRHDAVPFSIVFDLLIAADGVNSVARRTLFPASASLVDRGFSCIYLLVEAEGRHAPPGFLERANSGRSELIMGSIATLTLFPLGRGRLAFGIGFDHAVRARLWSDAGLTPDTPWAEVPVIAKAAIARRLTQDASDPALAQALDLVPDWNSYKIYHWIMRDTDPLARPYPDTGNVIILGDAAHAIMPTIGMGASLAMEDAEAFARLLRDRGLATTQDATRFRANLRRDAFAPFTASRVPVWRDLVRRSRQAAATNFIAVHAKRRFAIGPQIPGTAQSWLVGRVEAVLDRLGV
jgi:salicylate hydroxylase